MPVIRPTSLKDCLDFISQHEDDIKNGIYDVQIEPKWISSIPLIILSLLAQFSKASASTIAADSKTPGAVLEILSKAIHVSYGNHEAIASNPNTPLSVLERFSKHGYEFVRKAVASNPNTPATILEVLANDADERVKEGVAININTPVNIIEILAKANEDAVRHAVATNPKTSVGVLEILARDSVERIRQAAAKNIKSNKMGGCFLVTASCGTNSQEILILQSFRDKKLLASSIGRILILIYVHISPPLANLIVGSPFMQKLTRQLIINPACWVAERISR